jgi:diaminobutyrate-2-oxoglutarate transaminase
MPPTPSVRAWPHDGSQEAYEHEDRYRYIQSRESSARTYANSIDRVLERGALARLYDTEGREYLDCLACAGTLALGHNHPYVMERVRDFLDSGHLQQGLDTSTPTKYVFMRTLIGLLPAEFAQNVRIQFCGPTGSDAIEAAIKLFKTATGRRAIMAFHGGYHGMTAGALAITGNLNAKQQVQSALPDVHFLPYPYPYRCPFGLGASAVDVSLSYIERLLADPESGITKPAAVIVEAIQGEGGVIPAPARWLQGLRAITLAHDIPLVIDEVQTGLARTGDMFAFEHAGIVPDAVCLSKAIGGGYPLSVLTYHKRYDVWQPGAHAGTFRGNQIAMAAGTATMEFIQRENLAEQSHTKGLVLEKYLRALASDFPQIGDIRGRGLMWGMEIVNPHGEPDALGSWPAHGALAKTIKRECLRLGLIIETGGRHGAVLRLLPPLVITHDDLREVAQKLRQGIQTAVEQHERKTHD